jgi:tetratricopeptide (TPR) repeat protein
MRLAQALGLISLAVFAGCGGELDAQPRRVDGAPVIAALAAPSTPAAADLRAGRLQAARTTLEGLLSSNPDGISALNDLAVTYSAEERFDAARQLFEEVLARGGPRDQQSALVNLGELYAVDGYLGAAEAHLTSARAIDPSRAEPAYALALLADERGDRVLALARMRDALDADPTGTARRALVSLYAEERVHLEALSAEASGDTATAEARWRELARGRFRVLAQAAQRHLEQ